MELDDLHDLQSREPFDPFRIRLTSGDYYDIRSPFSFALMKSRLFIAIPNSDKSVLVPYQQIAAVETLTNGHPERPPRRKRGR